VVKSESARRGAGDDEPRIEREGNKKKRGPGVETTNPGPRRIRTACSKRGRLQPFVRHHPVTSIRNRARNEARWRGTRKGNYGNVRVTLFASVFPNGTYSELSDVISTPIRPVFPEPIAS